MQHVLRCWERQSDGSEYKKTLRWPGLCPDPTEGAYSAPANPLVGGEGLAVPSPRTQSPTLGPSGLASSTPHSKISSDAVEHTHVHTQLLSRQTLVLLTEISLQAIRLLYA